MTAEGSSFPGRLIVRIRRHATEQVKRPSRWAAAVALAPLALGTCSTTYVLPPNVMVIQNQRPSLIQSLAWTPCELSSQEPRPLPDSTIAPYQKIEIPLLPGCVNLYPLAHRGPWRFQGHRLFVELRGSRLQNRRQLV